MCLCLYVCVSYVLAFVYLYTLVAFTYIFVSYYSLFSLFHIIFLIRLCTFFVFIFCASLVKKNSFIYFLHSFKYIKISIFYISTFYIVIFYLNQNSHYPLFRNNYGIDFCLFIVDYNTIVIVVNLSS